MNALVSAREVAIACGVRQPGTVLAWARQGVIPFVPYGLQARFDLAAVRAALRAHRERPEPTRKRCSVCDRDLSLDQFRAKRDTRTARLQRSHDCNDCHKAYNEALRRRDAEEKGRAYRTREEIAAAAEMEERGRARAKELEREEQAKRRAERRASLRKASRIACSRCKEEQPRGRFHDSMLEAGRTVCKTCVQERDRAKFQKLKADAPAYQRRLESPLRRLRNRVGASMRAALTRKAGGKDPGVFRYLGYTLEDLRQHIERTFAKGMRWDNMHRWHIDHIVPVSAFTFTAVDDPGFRACYALTNLRALWKEKNLSKGARRTHLL